MIEKAFSGGKNFYLYLISLLFVCVYGAIFYIQQLIFGLGITGMGRDVSWGLYIANFTFFVGVAASAVMVVIPYYLHELKAYGRIIVIAEFLAVASVFCAIAFIFVDLGRPDRVLNIILYPSPNSLLFWDMVVLTGYLVINLILGFKGLDIAKKEIEPPSYLKFLVYLSIPWAISIHTVTAFIYCGLFARPFWFSALLAPRFLASAFTSGPAILLIVLIILRRFGSFDPGVKALENLKKTVNYALSVHIFFLLVELFTVLYSSHPEHVKHFEYMLFGIEGHTGLAGLTWTSLIISILSFVVLFFTKPSTNPKTVFFILVLLVFAIWAEKGLILMLAGFNPTPNEEIAKYVPTFQEISITIGVWALGSIILGLLINMAVNVKKSMEGGV